jgi:hypothetical protein
MKNSTQITRILRIFTDSEEPKYDSLLRINKKVSFDFQLKMYKKMENKKSAAKSFQIRRKAKQCCRTNVLIFN